MNITNTHHELFKKRKICLSCKKELSIVSKYHHEYPKPNETDTALLYESDIQHILRSLVRSFWKTLSNYRQQFKLCEDSSGTYDVGFGGAYESLIDRFRNENFVTEILHLDGIALCKSSKLKLWLLCQSGLASENPHPHPHPHTLDDYKLSLDRGNRARLQLVHGASYIEAIVYF